MASNKVTVVVSLDVVPALRQLAAVLAAATPVCGGFCPQPGLPSHCQECGHPAEAHEVVS